MRMTIFFCERDGLGVTEALRAMAIQPELYGELAAADLSSQSAFEAASEGKLVLEAKLDGMSRRQQSRLRKFLANPGSAAVICGTAKKYDTLKGFSGALYPVVKISGPIDIEHLRADIPQIYAEIKHKLWLGRLNGHRI